MPTPKVSADNRALAKHVKSAFQVEAVQVATFTHDTDAKLAVDVLTAVGAPDADLNSYSTIGLSDHAMPAADGDGEFPVRIELCMAGPVTAETLPNALASAAFHIVRSGRLHAPGDVLEGYLAAYVPDTTVPHLYLTAPFFIEDLNQTLELGAKDVTWLLAVPISEGERKLLAEKGDEALEDLLEAKEVDIFDLERDSAV